MRRAVRTFAAVVAAAAALATPAGAMTMDPNAPMPVAATVSIQFAAFAPPRLDLVAGDTLRWSNDSTRTHDVVALDQSFDSGRLTPGDAFERRLDQPGVVAYYCSIHPSMTGEIDVHEVLLDPPTQRAGSGKPYVVTGRAAPGLAGSVTIEGDAGAGFVRAATAAIAPDGTFRATVTPSATTTYRAVIGNQQSPPVQLLVLDHTVAVHVVRRGRSTTIAVQVTPSAPGQTVVLQLRLRERFGWWPVATAKLGADSTARFVVRRRVAAPARVLLTLPDGATELARSRTVRAGPLRAA